jgi:hypothetical protein
MIAHFGNKRHFGLTVRIGGIPAGRVKRTPPTAAVEVAFWAESGRCPRTAPNVLCRRKPAIEVPDFSLPPAPPVLMTNDPSRHFHNRRKKGVAPYSLLSSAPRRHLNSCCGGLATSDRGHDRARDQRGFDYARFFVIPQRGR